MVNIDSWMVERWGVVGDDVHDVTAAGKFKVSQE